MEGYDNPNHIDRTTSNSIRVYLSIETTTKKDIEYTY